MHVRCLPLSTISLHSSASLSNSSAPCRTGWGQAIGEALQDREVTVFPVLPKVGVNASGLVQPQFFLFWNHCRNGGVLVYLSEDLEIPAEFVVASVALRQP